MDLKHLRTFIVLAEELSFRKAAEKLHLTQPPISSQLSKLEADLGVKLLNRGRNQKVSLTPAGRFFLSEARTALRVAEQTIADVRRYTEGHHGRLRIACSDEFLFSPLARAIAEFTRAYPEVTLSQSTGASHAIIDQVESGEIDIGFFAFPVRQIEPRFSLREIWRPSIVAIVPVAHRLSGQGAIELADLRHDPMYLTPSAADSDFSPLFTRLFAPAKFSPKVLGYCASPLMMARIVGEGAGVGLVSRSSIPDHLPGIAILKLEDAAAFLVLGYALNPANANFGLINKLLSAVDRAFAG